MSKSDTKDRITSAAERLFSEHGFAGTSLRTVTSEAGVNLAAVHYHFGTKDALLRAVFTRRIEPVNAQRLQRLDVLQLEAGDEPPRLEDVLDAFLSPIMDLKRDLDDENMVWSRFIGRVYSEPHELVEDLISEQFQEVGQRFVAALEGCLPHLAEVEIVERLQFAIGAMIHTLIDLHRIILPGNAEPDAATDPNTLRHLIAFLAAAFRAPTVCRCESDSDGPPSQASAL